MSNTGVGKHVPRVEDLRFVTGHGRFVDDIALPEMASGCILRSPHAHARIRAIRKRAAEAAPGVLLVLTGDDVVREGFGPLECRMFVEGKQKPVGSLHKPTQPILATEKVRFVGDRVAFVVAQTHHQAIDAAELLEVDYEPLASSTSMKPAMAPGAAALYDDNPTNIAFTLDNGDRAGVERAFATAAHVARLEVHYPRAVANPLEPRSCIGVFEPFQRRSTLYSGVGAPFRQRKEIAGTVLGFPESDLRVVSPDVGGSFGARNAVYPEEALVVWAARKLACPVKWRGERTDVFMSDQHGRDMLLESELALAADGKMLALRVNAAVNVGAYLMYAGGAPANIVAQNLTNAYDLPLFHSVVRAVFTNTVPLGPYRGSGRPEAIHMLECLVDKAAREMRMDPVELRRRNIIRPEQMPYRQPSGQVVDCGDIPRMLERNLEIADWNGFAGRRAESERRGLRRGRGVAVHCAYSGLQAERMEIRVDPNGSLSVHAGTMSTGQGHETMYAQMVCEWLGVPIDHVRVLQGDTDRVLFGRGTYGERSAMVGGSALRGAADEVVRKGKRLAAWMLEADEKDLEFRDAEFGVIGTDRKVTLRQVSQRAYATAGLPPELDVGLDGVGAFSGPMSYPNGCMVAEVEVDPHTGAVRVDRLSAVDDVGVAINPHMVDGQLHGSTAQGLGQALLEDVRYDPESGQLLSASFLDYAMPRADHIPDIVSELEGIPTKTNPIGVKGGSESGNMVASPSIVNAIVDALAPLGVTELPVPATSERIWRAINGRGQR
jgi:aerobic carbon-monoxide dehydrogenase large subunit